MIFNSILYTFNRSIVRKYVHEVNASACDLFSPIFNLLRIAKKISCVELLFRCMNYY